MVNQENKKEYVTLYADFLLNTCVEKQFLAFQRGFDLVTSESPLHMMFTPQSLRCLSVARRSLISMSWRVPQSMTVASVGRLHVSEGFGRRFTPWLWRTRES